jgi:hypothetical protein
MDHKGTYIDGNVLCAGIAKAVFRSEEPLLCLIRENQMTLVAVSGLRLVVSQDARLTRPVVGNLAFVIPPLVAEMLACETVCSQTGVELALHGQDVVVRLIDPLGHYELRWKSDFAKFKGPEAFAQMVRPPRTVVSVPHLRFSDAAHQAVAKLGYIHADRQIHPNKLAILIDLNLGRLLVDGEEIAATERRRYYFDPRLVIRALEFLKEETIRVGITALPGDARRGYLSLISRDGDWTVHCALLSIGKDTQRLYPLSSGRSR